MLIEQITTDLLGRKATESNANAIIADLLRLQIAALTLYEFLF
jgi:hypothetical protein